jgi:hypothetical protein
MAACVAVGGSNSGTLAERWNGSQWSIQMTANPTGSVHWLSGVACPTSSNCTAVGSYYNGSQTVPLVEGWNGTTWTAQSVPLPAGATGGWLEDVSCVAVNSCMAVGRYRNSENFKRPLAARWNGTAWSLSAVAEAPSSAYGELMGVDCRTASKCTAVGQYFVGSLPYPYSVTWNGTSWNQLTMPTPEKATETYLNDVSCFGSDRCVAVGYTFSNGTVGYQSLVMSWNGTGWYVEPTPSRQNSYGSPYDKLLAASCPAAAECAVTGSSGDVSSQGELALGTPDVSATPEAGEEALELTDPTPVLDAEQAEEAKALIEEDPAFQAVVQGDSYALDIGSWSEVTKSEETVLIGVSATVAMVTPHDWEERVWPLIGYAGEYSNFYTEGTYVEGTMKASASEVTTLLVNLDAETDVNGNLVGGEVVMVEPVADETAELTYDPKTLEKVEVDPNGWEY